MVENSLLTEGIKGLIGVEVGPGVYEIEKGMIRRFSEAVGDPNPLWTDADYARRTNYGRPVAPPTFAATGLEGGSESALSWLMDMLMKKMPTNVWHVDAGTSCELFQPIGVGDTIYVTGKLVDLQERQGKSMGSMLFTIFELTSKNERGELVAKIKRTFCHYLT